MAMPIMNLSNCLPQALLRNTKRAFMITTTVFLMGSAAGAQTDIAADEQTATEMAAPLQGDAPAAGSETESKFAPGQVVPHSECLADPDNTPEECAERQRANAEQLAIAEAQMRANEASARQYQERMEAYNAQMEVYNNTMKSRGAAQSSYSETKAKYDQIRAQWEADVAACNAGDRDRCSKAPPPPQ
jgi:hypothetical protein